ncbi:site-specific integrase [Umezawaea sp. Da 62-37]|uniref:site-specific integrase n=1 Tax=Umezawaea sp. Da 62-37 TaxID=3075927 RepID=UPI0028F6FA90|nr:site-specific integrase [Umezawaea sp. Da 62-37]WNV83709.1 site-specific integrase [Umezawaea sp. Da 62-37]
MTDTTALVPSGDHAPTRTTADSTVSDSTRKRIADGVAANTVKAYARQWAAFADWCATQGRTPLPATPATLAEYIGHLADAGKGPSTCQQAMAAVAVRHDAAELPKPNTKGALLVLRSLRRERADAGQRAKQAPPVTIEVLRKLIDATDPDSATGKRDRLLLVLGLVMMSRRSELSALRIEDVTENEHGLEVLIRTSKTDRDSMGEVVPVPRGSHPHSDPVRLLRAWLVVLADKGVTTGPLLRSIDRHGRIGTGRLTTDSISRIVQRLAVLAGVPDAQRYTAHSLRAGGATAAYKAGAPVSAIKKQGRWKSDVVNEYIRSVDRWRDHPMTDIGL